MTMVEDEPTRRTARSSWLEWVQALLITEAVSIASAAKNAITACLDPVLGV